MLVLSRKRNESIMIGDDVLEKVEYHLVQGQLDSFQESSIDLELIEVLGLILEEALSYP